MKKIEKIKQDEERRKREFLRRIEYERQKRGITKKKENYEEQKARKYVRNINEFYAVFDPEKHLEITEGSKNEGKKHCSTKSQWKYHREELEKDGKVKPEIVEISEMLEKKNEKPADPLWQREKVILIFGNCFLKKEIRVCVNKNQFVINLETGEGETKVILEKFLPIQSKFYYCENGILRGKDIIDIALRTKCRIYKVEIFKKEEIKTEGNLRKVKYLSKAGGELREKIKRLPFTI